LRTPYKYLVIKGTLLVVILFTVIVSIIELFNCSVSNFSDGKTQKPTNKNFKEKSTLTAGFLTFVENKLNEFSSLRASTFLSSPR